MTVFFRTPVIYYPPTGVTTLTLIPLPPMTSQADNSMTSAMPMPQASQTDNVVYSTTVQNSSAPYVMER